MSKGITMNFSMVENKDGNCDMGFKCTSSDGLDIDYTISGEDAESMMKELLDDVSKDIIKQYTTIAEEEEKAKKEAEKKKVVKTDYEKELEAIIKNLQKENASLKADNKILQKRSDEKVNKDMNKKKPARSNHPASRFFFDDDNLFDKFLKVYF